MTNKITIDSRNIGINFPPYIIAEMSANHNGKIENAFKIIDQAKNAGADAVKIQTYTADTMTLDSDNEDFMINDPKSLWNGWNLYKLYQWAHTPWEWHKDLFDYAKKKKITIFSSPFDETAVDLLEDLNTPAYKIASFEATDLALIKYVASTKKPMIISTGLANEDEINEAIETAYENGCSELAMLHCVSSYPAPSYDYNLKTIQDMANKFNITTGLSDHTLGNTTAISAVALGASIIEKHFTLDRQGGGPDDSFSLEFQDLVSLCEDAVISWEAKGIATYDLKESEKSNLAFRRSLYFTKNIKSGETLKSSDFRCIRPGYGIAPKYKDTIIGKRLKKDVYAATPIKFEHFE